CTGAKPTSARSGASDKPPMRIRCASMIQALRHPSSNLERICVVHGCIEGAARRARSAKRKAGWSPPSSAEHAATDCRAVSEIGRQPEEDELPECVIHLRERVAVAQHRRTTAL